MSNNYECGSGSWGFEDKSVSDREQCLRNKNADSSVFGSYKNTYHWVECESTSFPGKIYYFNLRTLCTTWIRPVSRHVPLQRFRRNQTKFDDSFTGDLHDASMVVSSDSDYEYANSDDTKGRENKRKRKMSDILGHLYYGVDVHNCADSRCESVIQSSSEDPYHEEDFDIAFSDSSLNRLGRHFLTYHVPNGNRVNEASRENTDETPESSIATANFLEVEVRTAENMETREQSLTEDDVSFIEKQRIAYSTSSSNDIEVDENYNYFVPHLSRIKAKHLLKDGPVKKRRRRNVRRRAPVVKKNLKPTKIVCEMYGTKTINYNPSEVKEFEPPKVLPIVKQSNLSDSSETSLRQEETCKFVAWDKFKLPETNFRANNLSSDSSSNNSSSSKSSSSSGSCYTCEMSSNMTESTSSTDT